MERALKIMLIQVENLSFDELEPEICWIKGGLGASAWGWGLRQSGCRRSPGGKCFAPHPSKTWTQITITPNYQFQQQVSSKPFSDLVWLWNNNDSAPNIKITYIMRSIHIIKIITSWCLVVVISRQTYGIPAEQGWVRSILQGKPAVYRQMWRSRKSTRIISDNLCLDNFRRRIRFW